MKKFFGIMLMTLISVAAQAQDDLKTFRFGIIGGANFSTMNVDFDHKSRMGYNAGLIAEFNPIENIYLNASAMFVQKGVVFKDGAISSYGDSFDVTATPGYLQVSPHLGLRVFINDGLSIFGEFGPFWAYGIAGRLKDKDGSTSNKIDYFSEDGEEFLGAKPKRFDFGLGGVVGVEIGNVCKLGVSYDHGLTNAFNDDNPALKGGKTRSIAMLIAVMF